MALFATIKEEIGNLFKLLNPSKANEFFEKMKVRPMGYMLNYLIVSGLFLFVGYSLNIYYKAGFEAEIKCPLIASIESAFITCITLILSTLISGFIISLFGKGLVGRDMEPDEAVSIIGYPMIFILISGIFRAHIMTIILHYMFIAYSMYLLYTAISARFGFERALVHFIFILIIISLVVMILFWMGTSFLNFLVWIGLPSIGIPISHIPPWCH